MLNNATDTAHFGFVFEKKIGRGNYITIVMSSLLKSSVQTIVCPREKEKSAFQIPPVHYICSQVRTRFLSTAGVNPKLQALYPLADTDISCFQQLHKSYTNVLVLRHMCKVTKGHPRRSNLKPYLLIFRPH